MRLSLTLFTSALGLALFTSSASAQHCMYYLPPQAPNMCGPGFYYYNCWGMVYGPNYVVRPQFPPFQGFILPGMPNKNGMGSAMAGPPPEFATHPFARSPRDYFMYDSGPQASPYRYGPVTGSRFSTADIAPTAPGDTTGQ